MPDSFGIITDLRRFLDGLKAHGFTADEVADILHDLATEFEMAA